MVEEKTKEQQQQQQQQKQQKDVLKETKQQQQQQQKQQQQEKKEQLNTNTTTNDKKLSKNAYKKQLRLAKIKKEKEIKRQIHLSKYDQKNKILKQGNKGHINYHKYGGPKLTILWTNDNDPLEGQTLYLGGEVGCDKKIYCIPGHAEKVLCINPYTDKVYTIGPKFIGKYKWLRGVPVNNDTIIYGLPCHSDCILKINILTQEITTIPIPYEEFYNNDNNNDNNGEETEAYKQRHMTWKYHGGTISPIDKCIYAIPQSASHVLRINPITEKIDFIGPYLPGRWKFYGGIIGKSDNAIYGIPHNYNSVLRIKPTTTTNNNQEDSDSEHPSPPKPKVTLHGNYPSGIHNWHGAAATTPDGIIVSVPANANTSLCIIPVGTTTTTNDDDDEEDNKKDNNNNNNNNDNDDDKDDNEQPKLIELGNVNTIATMRHRNDNKYKYLGAMAGIDGLVYCFPCASERVLQVNPYTKEAKMIGPNLYDNNMEKMVNNKWQNGITDLKSGYTYGIPLNSETVLQIDCNKRTNDNNNDNKEEEEEPTITTWKMPIDDNVLDKFEGAVLAPNGVIYTVPNNYKGVLRIEPPPPPPPPPSSSSSASSSLGVSPEEKEKDDNKEKEEEEEEKVNIISPNLIH